VQAQHIYAKGNRLWLKGIDLHINSLVVLELELCTVEPEVLCCVHKLQQPKNGECDSLEEVNFELLEARGGDSTKKKALPSTR